MSGTQGWAGLAVDQEDLQGWAELGGQLQEHPGEGPAKHPTLRKQHGNQGAWSPARREGGTQARAPVSATRQGRVLGDFGSSSE